MFGMKLATIVVSTSLLMVAHCSELLAQDARNTFRLSTPIVPDASYWAYVVLSQPSPPVTFVAIDESTDEVMVIKSEGIRMREEGEESEQLFLLNDIPSFGETSTYVIVGIPERKRQRDAEPTLVQRVALTPRSTFKDAKEARQLDRRVAVVVPTGFRPIAKDPDSRVQLVYSLDATFCAKPAVRRIVNNKWQTVWEQPWTPRKETSYAIPWSPHQGKVAQEPGMYHFALLLSTQIGCAELNKKKGAAETLIETWFVIERP